MLKISNSDIKQLLDLALSHLGRGNRVKLLILVFSSVTVNLLEILVIIFLTAGLSLGTQFIANPESTPNISWLIRLIPVENNLDSLPLSQALVFVSIAYVLLAVIKAALSSLVNWKILHYLARQSASASKAIILDLFNNLTRRIRFGSLQENLTAVNQGVDAIYIVFLANLIFLVSELLLLMFTFVMVTIINFKIAIALVIFLITVLFSLSISINQRVSKLSEQITSIASIYNRELISSMSLYREIVLAGRVNEFIVPLSALRHKMVAKKALLSFLPSFSKYIIEISLTISLLVISVILLVSMTFAETVTLTVLTLAISARLLPSFMRIQGYLIGFKQSFGASIFTRELYFDLKQEKNRNNKDNKLTSNLNSLEFSPTIVFEDVRFSYRNDGEEIFPGGLSLTINEGECIALVGASGSGKTTLVELLLGFLEPTRGRISISGKSPIESRKFWPGSISYLPQHPEIFTGSIIRNISFADDSESDLDLIYKLLADMKLTEELNLNRENLHLELGEGGVRLSGGQKQRLSYCRALYTSPKLLILDEPTSSLDAFSHKLISESIKELKGKSTIILIAHTKKLALFADNIFYFHHDKKMKLTKLKYLRSDSRLFRKLLH